METKDSVALITGGARIGRTVAADLARRGCHVALTYRHSRRSADESAESVHTAGRRSMVIQADLLDPAGPEAAVDGVVEELGRLDILICMASSYVRESFDSLDRDAWRSGLDTDLTSIYRLAKRAAPVMLSRGAGRIITLADWSAASGRPRYRGYAPYYVAKTGVVGLTESLALELAPTVLVNCIAPGPILRPADLPDEVDAEVIRATPLGRWGGPGEIAKAVGFLIESDFTTGETIRVDGGRHLY